MHLGVKRSSWIRKSSRRFFAGVLVAICLVGVVPPDPTYAQNSDVYVVVGESELALEEIEPTLVINAVPFKIFGKVKSLNQVQVHVDNTLTEVIPLVLTDTQFEYDLSVDPGQHEVQFVGISPTGSDPAVSITVKYSPAPPGTVPEPIPTTGRGGTQVQSGDNLNQPGSVDLTSGPIDSLESLITEGLVALDFARPGDTSMTGVMFARFALLLTGLALLFFPLPALNAYRVVRYEWLHIPSGGVPSGVSRRPLAYIRGAGAVLIIFVLLLL